MSRRGTRLVYLVLIVLIVSVVWRDYLSGALGVFAAGFMFFNYTLFRAQLEELQDDIVLKPGGLSVSITAGEVYATDLSVSYSGDMVFSLEPRFGGFSEESLEAEVNNVEYRFEPQYAGEYIGNLLTARCSDVYELFDGVSQVPFEVAINVYPRVYPLILEALEYLEGAGALMMDGSPSQLKGDGLEYAESREYVSGDDMRDVDWKATARLGRLIVKDYHRDQSGSVHLIYEPDYTDPVSGDLLAAAFLEAVLSYADLGVALGLTVLDDGEVVFHDSNMYPAVAVGAALRVIYEGDVELFSSLYSVLDPVPRRRLDALLSTEFEASVGLSKVRDDLASGLLGGLLYVSCLVDDPVPLLELLDYALVLDVPVIVYEPCIPWKSVSGLETAVEIFDHYERVNRSLESMGVGVAVTLDEAHEILFNNRGIVQ